VARVRAALRLTASKRFYLAFPSWHPLFHAKGEGFDAPQSANPAKYNPAEYNPAEYNPAYLSLTLVSISTNIQGRTIVLA